MKPLIGIISRVVYPGETGKMAVNEPVRSAVVRHGGNPICLLFPQDIDYTRVHLKDQPDLTLDDKEMIKRQIDLCDGVLFPGGFRISKADKFILDYVLEKDIPVLGICLGMQTLASTGAESLTNEKIEPDPVHQSEEEYVHFVTLDKSSKLYQIIGKDRFMVNSRHSMKIIPSDKYVVTSLSDDNVVESIEFPNKKYAIGVQWHPENLNDEESNKILESFIKACKGE